MINLHKNFLGYIFRILRILNNADGGIVNHILPGINNCFKSSLVALLQLFYKRPFVQIRCCCFNDITEKISPGGCLVLPCS